MNFTASVLIILFVLVAVLKWITAVSLDEHPSALTSNAMRAPTGTCIVTQDHLTKEGERPGIIRTTPEGEKIVLFPSSSGGFVGLLSKETVLEVYLKGHTGDERDLWDDCLERFALFGSQ